MPCAECTRQRPKKHTAKALPCAAHGKGHTAKLGTAKTSLPCAKNRPHGKSRVRDPRRFSDRGRVFAVCKHTAKPRPLPCANTRQSHVLCRVLAHGKVFSNFSNFYFLFFILYFIFFIFQIFEFFDNLISKSSNFPTGHPSSHCSSASTLNFPVLFPLVSKSALVVFLTIISYQSY